jgi:biotin carboxyl carrier protein
LKLHVEIDGQSGTIDVALDQTAEGVASVEEVTPGVYSILLGTRSFTVGVAAKGGQFEAVATDQFPRPISVADVRDRRGSADNASSKGPAIIRAEMPGKIVKVLVDVKSQVEAGQGLMIVEAMKMQNEVKAPKAGTVAKIQATEGATVAAGETLIVVE